jgi:hypothetical protein
MLLSLPRRDSTHVPVPVRQASPSPSNERLGSRVVHLSRLQASLHVAACVLAPSEEALDAPLGTLGSLRVPGACYPALRCLPGRVLHPLEKCGVQLQSLAWPDSKPPLRHVAPSAFDDKPREKRAVKRATARSVCAPARDTRARNRRIRLALFDRVLRRRRFGDAAQAAGRCRFEHLNRFATYRRADGPFRTRDGRRESGTTVWPFRSPAEPRISPDQRLAPAATFGTPVAP